MICFQNGKVGIFEAAGRSAGDEDHKHAEHAQEHPHEEYGEPSAAGQIQPFFFQRSISAGRFL